MKKPSASYRPTQIDLDWAKQVMNLIAEGGVLSYPSTKLVYVVSHEMKTLTLQNPDQLHSFPSFVVHYQTIDVFREIGYAVLPPKDEEKTA